jgi:hypothetical protein
MQTFQVVRYGAEPSERPNLDIWLRRYADYSAEEKRACKEWATELKKFQDDRQDPTNKAVLEQWGRLPFNTDHCFGLIVDGETVSYLAARFSTKKHKNAWGRYLSWHFSYTPVVNRRCGFASRLFRDVQQLAYFQGFQRVKSVCQTYLGFRLHLSLGHEFWGLDKKNGTLVVDAALNPEDRFPEGVPIEARCALGAHKLSNQELTNILLAPPYSVSPEELRRCWASRSIKQWI